MKIDLTLPKNRFVLREDIPLYIKVTNEGKSPVQIPDPFDTRNNQPLYRITGSQKREFSAWSITTKNPDAPPKPGDLIMRKLAAGESIEQDVPLHDWARLFEPGEYALEVAIEFNGTKASSQKVSFTLESFNPEFASVGIDYRMDKIEMSVELIHAGDSGRQIYRSFFVEERPDLGEVKNNGTGYVCDAGESANQVLSPWANYDRMDELHSWRCWLEDGDAGASVVAHSPLASAPIRVEIGKGPSLLVRPAWMNREGYLYTMVFIGDSPELVMTRFSAPKGGNAPGKGEVMFRMPIDRIPTGAASVMMPEDKGSTFYVAWLEQDGDDVLLKAMDLRDGTRTDKVIELRLPKAYTFEFSSPAVVIDDAGFVRVSALLMEEAREVDLVEGEKDRLYLFLAQATLSRGGRVVHGPERKRLTSIKEPPTMGAVAYSAASKGIDAPFWLAWFNQKNEALTGRIDTETQTVQLSDMPSVPLDLLPLANSVYLMLLDPQRGALFHALPIPTGGAEPAGDEIDEEQ